MDQPLEEILSQAGAQAGIAAATADLGGHGATRSRNRFMAVAREGAPADGRRDHGRACGG